MKWNTKRIKSAAKRWKGPRWNNPAGAATLLFLCAAGALLAFPREVQHSVKNSILYCLTVLAPSLFPFLALTGFAMYSGASDALGSRLGFLARYLFRLPAACAVPIFMSFVGGYPAGAKGAELLLRQGKITKEQANRMMLFCINPGVAFVVTFLGGAVLGSFRVGWLLFFSVTLSSVLLGFLSGLFSPIPPKNEPISGKAQEGALIRSAADASSAVLKMCACIVLFAGISTLLHCCGVFQFCSRFLASFGVFTPMEASAVASFLLEVTEGVGAASTLRVSPPFFAFGLAFGGFCVHLQVFSVFEKFPTKKWLFYIFRILHGITAAGCYLLLTKLLPGSQVETLAPVGAVQNITALSGTAAGGLSLLLMCMAFLLIVEKSEKEE